MDRSYLESLNDAQKEAVLATEGPVVVLAGAGSGKTKTLITRIAHLIHEGAEPSSILAVTFTNKAAAEMKHRVESILRGRSGITLRWAQPWMGFSSFMPEVSTFHSFCVKLLRNEAHRIGFSRPFVIYDDDDQLSLIRKVLEGFDISTKNANPKRFKGAIDQAKCQARGPEEIDPKDFFGPFGEQLVRVYRAYQERLRASQAFDFGDLIVEAWKILRDHPDALAQYQERFRYLMVDEYQDTNRAQYLLVKLLAERHRNLCVVGDEDQSIYKWRGADIKNILDFRRDYPEARLLKLEQNYRSTQTIIEGASAVIRNNRERYDKTLWTANPPGEKIRWSQLPDERGEADFVGHEIERWLKRHADCSYQDVAVFYRSHAQSRALEECFRRSRIPYRIVGGVGFYERREIKDALAYLRVLVNPDDSVSLLRIVNVPARGLGKSSIEKVEDFARERGLSLFAGMKALLQEGAPSLPPSAARKLADFVRLLDSFRDLAARSLVSETFHHILDATGYVAELKSEHSDDANARIQNLEELDTVIQFFEEESRRRGGETGNALLQGFINQVTLEASLLEKTDAEGTIGAVSMMTLHSSKGLEFPLVFLVGCEEGIFPSRSAIDEEAFDREAIEEERRLCYVGMTRAKQKLFLTNAQVRRIYGQVQVSPASRFLNEIPPALLESEQARARPAYAAPAFGAGGGARRPPAKPAAKRSGTPGGRHYEYDTDEAPTYQVQSTSAPDGKEIQVGQRVRHQSYGAGTVKVLEGSASDRKITIEFAGRMVKKFSLKHVELELL